MKNKKLIDLYKEWMETGRMDDAGLCQISMNTYWEETFDEYFFNHIPKNSKDYWGSGLRINHKNEQFTFTPLRQTIVLLICAIHNEL